MERSSGIGNGAGRSARAGRLARRHEKAAGVAIAGPVLRSPRRPRPGTAPMCGRRPACVIAASAAFSGAGALARERSATGEPPLQGWQAMDTRFVLIGPAADPAGVAGLRDAAEALRRIAWRGAPFVSRGHGSGAHDAELRLWRAAGVDPLRARGRWYREVGGSAGAALDTAAALDAYALPERGAWLAFRDRRNLRVFVEDDQRLSR